MVVSRPAEALLSFGSLWWPLDYSQCLGAMVGCMVGMCVCVCVVCVCVSVLGAGLASEMGALAGASTEHWRIPRMQVQT